MAGCDKCWDDAHLRSRLIGKDRVQCYNELLKERENKPCSIEDQNRHKTGIELLNETLNNFKDKCLTNQST